VILLPVIGIRLCPR